MPWKLTLGREGKKVLGLALRCSRAGVLIGFLLGIYEGVLVIVHQRHILLIEPAVSPAILLLAPLVNALGYATLGGLLGSVAALCHRKFPGGARYFIALGVMLPCFQLIYLPAHEWIKISSAPHMVNAAIALLGSLVLVTAALRYWLTISTGCVCLEAALWSLSRSLARRRFLTTGAAFAGLVSSWMILAVGGPGSQMRPNTANRNQPNIVIIALDTARADHFSAYGYPKPTTPYLDSVADRGVLFETAIAPSSWTLPSFATVLTGLLPHQNATASETPLAKGYLTLASILRCRGYQTVAFNANPLYGTARTGLAQGFDMYNDDNGTLRSHLVSLDFVKAFWFGVYVPFVRPQPLQRRDARTLNQAVLEWFRHRRSQPFFLLLNYFDVHEPYVTIPEVGGQFGTTRTTLLERIRSEVDPSRAALDRPRSPTEQAALVASYDSALAFTDSQIGNLIQILESSPEWSNTYIIVFGDHGQAFGTHHHYGHGWGLNWELLHVPLIIAGPGIPPGRRVRDLVGLQQLFATVLDLSAPQSAVPVANSLRCSWMLPPGTRGGSPEVISEFAGHDEFSISIVTPERHLIRDASDKLQLYDLIADPNEEVNLAGAPEHQAEIAALQSRLFERIQASTGPWLGEDYLWALGERAYSQLPRGRSLRTNWPYANPQRPSTPENELLQSLPYQ